MARSPRPSQAERQRASPVSEPEGVENEFSEDEELVTIVNTQPGPIASQDDVEPVDVDAEGPPSISPATSNAPTSRQSSSAVQRRAAPREHPLLFTMAKLEGRPAHFAIHTQATDEQRRMTKLRIEAHGGKVVEDEYESDVYLVPDRLVHQCETRFRDSRSVYVQALGWVMQCIKSKTFFLAAPPPKRMPGRPPGNIRTRIEFSGDDIENLCQYLARRCPHKAQGGRQGNSVYQELMNQGEVEPTKAWAKRHTWHSWRTCYKTRQIALDARISEIVADFPEVHDLRKGQLEYVRVEAGVRRRIRQNEQDDDEEDRDGAYVDEENMALGNNQDDLDDAGYAAAPPTMGHGSPITAAGPHNTRTHWRNAQLIKPVKPVDPRSRRSASLTRGEHEHEEESEEDVPRSRRGNRPSPASVDAAHPEMPPPDAIPKPKNVVRPRPLRNAQANKNRSNTPSGNFSLQRPEVGMNFVDDLPEPTYVARAPKPRVTQTYSRILSQDHQDRTIASSQQTLVDPSQRAGPSRLHGLEDQHPQLSRSATQQTRRSSFNHPPRSTQDTDVIPHSTELGRPVAGDTDKPAGFEEELDLSSPPPPETHGEQQTGRHASQPDENPEEDIEGFSSDDLSIVIVDAEDDEVAAQLQIEETDETQNSHKSANNDAEQNMFDGEFKSAAVQDSSLPRHYPALPSAHSPLPDSASTIHARLLTAANAGIPSVSLEPQQSSNAASLSTPQRTPRAGLPTTATRSHRRPRSPSPGSDNPDEDIPVVGPRARAEVERQRLEGFTPGPRAEQVRTGTAHLRKSKRLKK